MHSWSGPAPGLDISVFQQASSSLPPTPTALPEVTDKLRVMLEKDSLVSTEVEMPMPKGSLPETVVATGASEMKMTGTNSRLSSGQAPDEGIEKEKQLTDDERESTTTKEASPKDKGQTTTKLSLESAGAQQDLETNGNTQHMTGFMSEGNQCRQTSLVPEKGIIPLSTAQVEKLSGMKDAELQQTQGK